MDIAVYTGGALRHTKVIPYAGNVADQRYRFMPLAAAESDAEAIKVRHGCALGSIAGKDEMLKYRAWCGRPPRSLQRQTLEEAIEPRYTELLNLVNEEILQYRNSFANKVKHHRRRGLLNRRRGANRRA